MEKEDTITISLKEYRRLLSDARMLLCLEDAGVNNWDGYDYAMDDFNNFDGTGDNRK